VVNRASAAGHHTAVVGGPRLSSNADRQRSSGIQHGLQLATRRRLVAVVIGDGLVSLASGAELAVASLSNVVRIISVAIQAYAFLNTIGVGIMGPATVSAIVGVCASSALLHRLDDQRSVLDLVEGLLSLISRVSPAGTALSLILDRGDSALGAPVNDAIGDDCVSEGGHVGLTIRKILHEADAEFFRGLISEDVDTKNGFTTRTNVILVLLGNAVKIHLEDTKSVLCLLQALISAVEFDHELIELFPFWVLNRESGDKQKGSNEKLHSSR